MLQKVSTPKQSVYEAMIANIAVIVSTKLTNSAQP